MRAISASGFIDWLGLEDMFELYGSTEAAIATYRRKNDPRGSVGEIIASASDTTYVLRRSDSRSGAQPPVATVRVSTDG